MTASDPLDPFLGRSWVEDDGSINKVERRLVSNNPGAPTEYAVSVNRPGGPANAGGIYAITAAELEERFDAPAPAVIKTTTFDEALDQEAATFMTRLFLAIIAAFVVIVFAVIGTGLYRLIA